MVCAVCLSIFLTNIYMYIFLSINRTQIHAQYMMQSNINKYYDDLSTGNTYILHITHLFPKHQPGPKLVMELKSGSELVETFQAFRWAFSLSFILFYLSLFFVIICLVVFCFYSFFFLFFEGEGGYYKRRLWSVRAVLKLDIYHYLPMTCCNFIRCSSSWCLPTNQSMLIASLYFAKIYVHSGNCEKTHSSN